MTAYPIEQTIGYNQSQAWSSTIYNNIMPAPQSVSNSTEDGVLSDLFSLGQSVNVAVTVLSNAQFTKHNSSDQAPSGGTGAGFTWLERLHILPQVIDAGFIPGDVEYTLRIHSAYRSRFVDLSTLNNNISSSGVSVDAAAPDQFSPLTTKSYLISITEEGTPSFSGEIEFVFDSGQSLSVLVLGSRIILIPWVALNGAKETLKWKTELLKAYGREQRRSLRRNPIRQINLRYLVRDDERQKIESLLSAQTQPFCVPFWWDVRDIGPVSAGATTISINTDNSEFKVGGLIFIYESINRFESIEIASISSGSIGLSNAVEGDFINARGIPAFGGYIKTANIDRQTNNINFVEASFELINAFNYDLPSTTQHRGFDVLTDPTVALDVNLDIRQSLSLIDNEIRPFRPFKKEDRTRKTDIQHWIKDDKAGRQDLKKWIYSRRGMAIPFFYPTWQKDIILSQDISSVDTDITVEKIEVSAPFDIMIKLIDGTFLYSRVTSAIPGSPETLSVITISSALGRAVSVSDIDRISLMRLSRHAVDQVDLNYSLPDITRASISVTEI